MILNVIKIGGNVIDNQGKLQSFLEKFSSLEGPKILIHGGGKIATKTAEKLGITTQMVDGRRITDEPMRDVVLMVYGGLVNKLIVAFLQAKNCNALGLSGADGAAILAKKRPVKTIDYGFVGDIEKVNDGFIENILNLDIAPVFCPLTFDTSGNMLNTNADTQASAIAVAMSKRYTVNLVYCFEKKGVLEDAENENTVIPEIRPDLYQKLKTNGKIFAGMIPKLDNAFAALHQGVSKVIICEAEEILIAIQNKNSGTQILL